MPDGLLYLMLAAIGLLMIYAAPFIAFWDLGAGMMFLVVGVGTMLGLALAQD